MEREVPHKRNYIAYTTFPVQPDHELRVWEEWIAIRREEILTLAKKLRRPPIDLTMNLLDKVREKKEEKFVLENAQISKKPYLRGGIWEQPERLKQSCHCQPVYEIKRSPSDIGRPRIVEHIGVPHHIKATEMGLIGAKERKACKKLNAEYEVYKEKRESQLKNKIMKIDPHKPDIDRLLVIGSKPKRPPPALPCLPEIKVTDPSDPHEEALSDVYAIRINNTVIYKESRGQDLTNIQKMQQENWHENCLSWTYYFNVSEQKIARSTLYLENLGTVTIRYCWKKIKRPIPYVPDEPLDQIFFFNKNEDVISPGQVKKLLFTFVSEKPGIYNEYWEFNICNVFMFENLGTKLLVNLHADSTEDALENSKAIENIMIGIQKTDVYRFVTTLVDDLVEKATVIEPLIYPYKYLFLEAELFVMKNPVCFYHQTEVLKMHEKYKEMCGGTWDLSIHSWRAAMMEKEFDERMANYNFLKKSHSELLKPWFEGEDLLKDKHRAVRLLLGQLFDKFFDVYQSISEIYGTNKDFLNHTGVVTSAIPRVSKCYEHPQELNPVVRCTINNIFYLHMYEHVANTIEWCAGVISSLDLNRWIEFDFCQ